MKSRSLKFKIFLIVIAVCCIFCTALISLYTPVIFQRGNPIPYLIASTKLNTETPYAQVKQTGSETVYITKRGVGEELLQLFAENTGAELQEQLGGTYIFSDGESEWMIESEIYWRNYTVWEIPTFINNAGEQPIVFHTSQTLHVVYEMIRNTYAALDNFSPTNAQIDTQMYNNIPACFRFYRR